MRSVGEAIGDGWSKSSVIHTLGNYRPGSLEYGHNRHIQASAYPSQLQYEAAKCRQRHVVGDMTSLHDPNWSTFHIGTVSYLERSKE